MFKKLGMMLLAGLMVVSLAACGSNDSFKAGTFTGEADGFGGKVTVELTLDETKTITGVNVTSTETDGIGEVAIDKLSEKVLATNSIEVDAVAGATMSSTAFVEAAKAALDAAGLTNADLAKKEVESGATEVTKDVDVVVVGAGGAGMTAAITAAQAGKTVIIVEEAAITGGNSSRATGGMNAAKTELQDKNTFGEEAGVEKGLAAADAYDNLADLKATVAQQWADYQANPEGYFDSVELFILDTMVGGKGINNIDLVTTLATNSADAIDWLANLSTPIALTDVSSFGGASVKRIHRPLNAEGKTVSVGSYMVPLLEENCKSLNVEILTETEATSIIMNEGAAAGIVAVNGETTYTINAKSVVLASGGFGANLDMVVEYKPELAGFASTNASTITGDGIKMAMEAGAATVDMEQIQIHPTVYVSETGSTSLITEGLRGDGAILVNQEGVRFCDEVGTRDAVSAAELAQTGSYAYLIVDQAMVDASSVIAGYITKGLTMNAEGQSAADLAATLGCDAATLENTISTWNSYVEAKEDPEFGRTSFANPLVDSYYAIKITPAVHHTMGGIAINTSAEVLNAEGTAIANLFAAGEITGGVHGANRLGGNAVADIVVFGRIAGASAAANAQ